LGLLVLPIQLHLQIKPGGPPERQKTQSKGPIPAGGMQEHGSELWVAEFTTKPCETG